MRVVYGATRNLYPHLVPAIRSLLDHNDPELIYIMAEDDELPVQLPPARYKIINVSGQQVFNPFGPNANSIFTYMAMMRLCYVVLLDCDKVLQLDVDTIVCDSLAPLWNVDLTGKWFTACEEYLGRWKPYGPKYYNIGVAVFNLAQMRADDCCPTMVQDLNTHKYWCVEQDVLNKYAVPAGKVAPFPGVRYNECFCCGQTPDPAVVHYAGYHDWTTNKRIPRVEYLEKYRDSPPYC